MSSGDQAAVVGVGPPLGRQDMRRADAMRTDIQALRGVAVLMVVVYHLDLGVLRAGYLGVDVFFVISGFLITSLIVRGLDRGEFTLREFYWRRAKRLLPAAYVTIFATALAAPLFLSQRELHDFALQVLGAVTFTANFFLWQQTGYFEGASELKPLLHTWSLSLEEQYYLVLPAVLLMTAKAWRFRVLAALLCASLVLCAWGLRVDPVATFYLLPTRAWELLLGSLGALLVLRSPPGEPTIANAPLVRWLFAPSVLCLLSIAVVPVGDSHPGLAALLACLSTLVVILRRHAGVEGLASTRALARLGDISYSLYLVHWPVIALMKNAWMGPANELPLGLKLSALAISLSLAYLLYRYVEHPIHRANIAFRAVHVWRTVLASTMLVLIVPTAIHATSGDTDFRTIRQVNYGLDRACNYSTAFSPKPECMTTPRPEVIVWGDSFAMHLVPGLASEFGDRGVLQATRSSCGPVLDVGPQRLRNPEGGPVYDRAWALSCLDFNRSVYDFVSDQRNGIRLVVMSSPLAQYVSADWINLVADGQDAKVVQPSVEQAAASLLRTVDLLRRAGKRVVLVAPPPTANFNVGACLERRKSGRIALGVPDDCTIPVPLYRARQGDVLRLIDLLERSGTPVIRFDEFLCDQALCRTSMDGTMLFRDSQHFSVDGSRLVAARMGLANQIETKAR